MESSGRNDDTSNQLQRGTERNINQGTPQNVLYEGSASQSSLNRNNSNQNDAAGLQRLSSDRTSSFGGSSRRRHSLSSRVAPDISDDDVQGEVVSQAGDIGDRELNSMRYRESETPHSPLDIFMSVEDGTLLSTGGPYQTFGSLSSDANAMSTPSVVSRLPSEVVSSQSAVTSLYPRDKDQNRSAQTSLQGVKEFTKELPWILEYVSCLLHLAVFGILGVFTRYLLQKLFGPQVAGVTGDESFAYLDLPSNVVGSFLMGWFGVVFKGDISHVSDFLAIGLSTGYLGSVTTFSGWNQKMLDLSVKGLWVHVAVGIILGLLIVTESIHVGIETAKGFRWLLNRYCPKSDASNLRNSFRIDSFTRHMAVIVVLVLLLGLLWALNGVLLRRWVEDGKTNGTLWLACIVGPPGVWVRWFLARLNGRGLGRNGVIKWFPFGTLIANVSAACMMASLATVKRVVNTERCETIATGIQFGFLGCLSTVSTFMAEFHAMRESEQPWRAYVYASATILPSFILGTLIYSVPVWTKGYLATEYKFAIVNGVRMST